MPHRVVARYQGRLVGRYHGGYTTHVVVLVLANGRIQCRGWGLRVEAEAALERARHVDPRLRYAAVHETEPDADSSQPLVHSVRALSSEVDATPPPGTGAARTGPARVRPAAGGAPAAPASRTHRPTA